MTFLHPEQTKVDMIQPLIDFRDAASDAQQLAVCGYGLDGWQPSECKLLHRILLQVERFGRELAPTTTSLGFDFCFLLSR